MIDLIFKVLLLVVIFAVLVVFILIKEIKRRREEIIEKIKVYIPSYNTFINQSLKY